jgi:hypothetical protein
MGTNAIFKIYDNGKFVMGSWIKYDGGVDDTSALRPVLYSLGKDFNKQRFYHTINKFVNDGKFGSMFGNKKKPFINQINEEGMAPVDVLFWDIPLSDKKLMEDYIWGQFIYEIRYVKDGVNIKVSYNGNEITKKIGREMYGNLRTADSQHILMDLNKWVDEIDYGLNDCNCGEDNKEITEENI